MKTVILGVDENNRPIWNATFKDLTATGGFVPRVCRARRPQTKGKGESGIGLVKDNFLPGRRYSGKEVVVKERNGKIEILYEGKVIATHEKRYRSGGVVFLKDQYKGLEEAEGMIYPKPIAIKVSSLEVGKRSLGVYQSLLEVDRV